MSQSLQAGQLFQSKTSGNECNRYISRNPFKQVNYFNATKSKKTTEKLERSQSLQAGQLFQLTKKNKEITEAKKVAIPSSRSIISIKKCRLKDTCEGLPSQSLQAGQLFQCRLETKRTLKEYISRNPFKQVNYFNCLKSLAIMPDIHAGRNPFKQVNYFNQYRNP